MENTLTDEQKKIVSHIDGPALVVAGAGTGKTFTMTSRLKYLIDEIGILPENILVLTFTNAAAKSMVSRAVDMIGMSAENITACTFHSFCNILMHKYNMPNNTYTILDSNMDEDMIQLIKSGNELYSKYKLPRASVLSGLFSAHINQQKSFEELFKTSKYEKYALLEEIIYMLYDEVKNYKKEHNLVNYDDMLLYALDILKAHGNKIRNQYTYVMIDEAQDTNYLQFEISKLLSNNVMFIGDPEQSIYKFRGADVETFMELPEQYPDMKIYTLSNNYRSTQEILDVANEIVKNSKLKYKAILHTGLNKYGDKPLLVNTSTQKEETDYIIDFIKQQKDLSETAIIYRNSVMSAKLEVELVKENINYQKKGGIKFFDLDCIRDVMSICRIFVNETDYLSWFRILQNHQAIGEKRAKQIIDSGDNFLLQNEFTGKKNKTSVIISEALKKLYDLVENGSKADYTTQLNMINDYYLSLRDENLEIIRSKKNIQEATIDAAEQSVQSAKIYVPILLDLMKDYKSIQDFLDNVALDSTPNSPNMIKNKNATNTNNEYIPVEKSDEPVTLTTIHSAKGLEWDNVIVMDAVQGIFPNTMAKLSYDEMKSYIAEEERCMYVAVTRPKKQLIVMKPIKAFQYGMMAEVGVSQYLKPALDNGLFEVKDWNCNSSSQKPAFGKSFEDFMQKFGKN